MRSLLQNEQLALDDYLQQVIPVVLTCVVAKELGASARDDHWAVRDLAAAAMGLLLEKFGPAYPELLSRVSNQLLKGLLDPSKPLTTHYGTTLLVCLVGSVAATLHTGDATPAPVIHHAISIYASLLLSHRA